MPSAAAPDAHCRAHTEFRCVHVSVFAKANGAVRVQFERLPPITAFKAGISGGPARGQQSAGILDVQGVDVGARRETARARDIVGIVMDRADREHERGDNELAAAVFDHPRTGDGRIRVVHRIGEAKAPDAIGVSVRNASAMNSGLAVSQEMKRKPVDMNCRGVLGVAAAISRMRSHGSSLL